MNHESCSEGTLNIPVGRRWPAGWQMAGIISREFKASTSDPWPLPTEGSFGLSHFECHARVILTPEKQCVLWEYRRRCRGFVILAEWITHKNAKERDGRGAGGITLSA